MVAFDMLDAETIASGRATDAYFLRTEETLQAAGRNPRVVLEVTANQRPTGHFHLFSGVRDVAELFSGLDVDVDAIEEGRLVDGGPVMRIEGRYLEVARYETALLGFLSHASAFATRALRARRAAPDTTLISFGSRHAHPAIAPVVERSALLAGFDGFSHVAAGDVLGRSASGTMPHSLIICFGRGEQQAAWRAFNDALPADVPRIALCDTFGDEVEEVRMAMDTLGADLDSVRIDTTSSRRGNFRAILEEIRWELDTNGYEDVGIFASGGIDATAIASLHDIVDGFGVGSFITDAEPIDFALDIVELDGEPIAKRGKFSGVKDVYRAESGETIIQRADTPAPENATQLLQPLLRGGDIVREWALEDATARALAEDGPLACASEE